MREKFKQPTAPDYHEEIFIKHIELHKKIKKDSLAHIIYNVYQLNESHHRRIRKMIEKYNNGLYKNIIPLGKIVTVNGFYTLVRSNDELANKVRNKAKYDMICGLIDYKNTLSILGPSTHDNQIDIYDALDMDLADLIELAKQLKED